MNTCKYIREKPTKHKTDCADIKQIAEPSVKNRYLRYSEKKNRDGTGRFIRTNTVSNVSSSRYEISASRDNSVKSPLKPLVTFLIYLYIASIYVLSYSERFNILSRGLFFLLIIATAANVLISGLKISVKIPDIMILVFAAYVPVSSMWVTSSEGVSNSIITIFQLVLLYFIVRINALSIEDIKVFIYAVLVGTLIMCVYTVFFYGIGTIIRVILAGGRIGSEINQQNGMGMYCSILSTIALYLALYEKKYWCLAILPLSLFIQLGCNSRKGFVLVFLGLFIVLFFRAGRMKAFVLLASVLLIYGFVLLCYRYQDSNTTFRRIYKLIQMIFNDAEGDDSARVRSVMMNYGIELFKKKPIQGYGPVQFEYFYSLLYGSRRPPHSTFIQILVSFGSIGFTLFYSSYLYYFVNFFMMLRKKAKYAVLFIALLVIMTVNDFGANMLLNKYLYIFIALFASYSELMNRENGEEYLEGKMQHGFKRSQFEK